SGTMAAGYLRRRGDTIINAMVPYLEITLPLSATIAVGSMTLLSPVWDVLVGDNPFSVRVLSLIGLIAISAVLIVGAIRHWPWWLRVCLGLTWFLVLAQSKESMIPWPLPLVAAILTGFLVGRHQVALRRATAAGQVARVGAWIRVG